MSVSLPVCLLDGLSKHSVQTSEIWRGWTVRTLFCVADFFSSNSMRSAFIVFSQISWATEWRAMSCGSDICGRTRITLMLLYSGLLTVWEGERLCAPALWVLLYWGSLFVIRVGKGQMLIHRVASHCAVDEWGWPINALLNSVKMSVCVCRVCLLSDPHAYVDTAVNPLKEQARCKFTFLQNFHNSIQSPWRILVILWLLLQRHHQVKLLIPISLGLCTLR